MPSTDATDPGGALLAPRRYRLTVRARLALTYAGLLTIAGAVILTIISVFIGLAPSYDFAAVTEVSSGRYSEYPADAYDITPPAVPIPGFVSPDNLITHDPGFLAEPTAFVVSSRGDILQLLLWVSAGALILLAAGGAWAGWFVAGRMLRPLQEVNAAVHRAARGQLDHRIAIAGPRDEISDLADTFDEMLTELERSFDSYRRFAANASHELRTPLATTRAMLDVALSTAPGPERGLLERLRETNERSIDTVESLLDLSEIESVSAQIESVDLAGLAESVLDDLVAEADEADVRIEYRLAPATVEGDRVLLRQLLTNLVQNAIRHNEAGGFASVSTSSVGGQVAIEVVNTGPVIPAETIPALASPFYRGRGRTSEAAHRGRGLGLSIVTAIVERHDATLELAARAGGGLRAIVRF